MRNILITVMMLLVVVVLFNNIISKDATGTRSQVERQGTAANKYIESLLP
ncbi:hypothetical protein ACFSTH_10685 [Paenibacillus yanchengensis]|uniref:Uncharacterized protein n=1 Tax=Paenibacillus yanchengensis TaxID=2035833 RepID=A0ABW4YJ66_9BACL